MSLSSSETSAPGTPGNYLYINIINQGKSDKFELYLFVKEEHCVPMLKKLQSPDRFLQFISTDEGLRNWQRSVKMMHPMAQKTTRNCDEQKLSATGGPKSRLFAGLARFL